MLRRGSRASHKCIRAAVQIISAVGVELHAMQKDSAPSIAATPDTTPAPRLLLVFIGLMLAMLLSALSQTVLSAAMPTMVGELDGVDHMLWIMTAFMLASTIAMPIYGKMGDLIGRKGLLVTAIVLFMAGSVLGAVAA